MDATLQHVLVAVVAVAAAAWIVGAAVVAGTLARTRAAGDAQAVVDRAARMRRVSLALTVPGALLVAGAGAWYVTGRDLSIDPNWWIGTAIGAWLVLTFGSTFFRARQLRAAVQLAGTQGADDEDVQWRIRRVDLTTRGELLLLVVATVVVALQPTAPL